MLFYHRIARNIKTSFGQTYKLFSSDTPPSINVRNRLKYLKKAEFIQDRPLLCRQTEFLFSLELFD